MRFSLKHLRPYTISPVSLSNLTTANVDNILATTPTNMGQVDLVEELTLRIQCDPIVSLTAPFNTKSLTIKSGGAAAHDSYHTPQWQVVLTRVGGNGDSLAIQLRSPAHSRLPSNFRSVNVIYHQRHLANVPLNESAFSNWGELKREFSLSFDVVVKKKSVFVQHALSIIHILIALPFLFFSLVPTTRQSRFRWRRL